MRLQIPLGFYAGQTHLSFREMVKAFLQATLSHFGKNRWNNKRLVSLKGD
jgi:hypothetical protein